MTTPTVIVSTDLPPYTAGICRFEDGVPVEILLTDGLSQATTALVVAELLSVAADA